MLDKNLTVGIVMLAIVSVCLIVMITVFHLNETQALTEMVSKGADPQAAACALNNNSTANNVCMTIATRNKEVK